MRKTIALLIVLPLFIGPSTVLAQNATFLQGFGGFTFGSSSVLGNRSMASTFGAAVAVDLTPNIQILGEAGRLSDIKPPILDLLEFTPVDLRVSAWYGQGGVRLIASPSAAVRPYGEATAGVGRLRTGLSGFDAQTDARIRAGLAFLNKTEPVLGAGGGVLLQMGPAALDLGYRYRRIVATGLASAINAGRDYNVHEVRAGIGIRF